MDNMVLEAAQLIYLQPQGRPRHLVSLNCTFLSQSDAASVARLDEPAYQEPLAVMPDAGICQRKERRRASWYMHPQACTLRTFRSSERVGPPMVEADGISESTFQTRWSALILTRHPEVESDLECWRSCDHVEGGGGVASKELPDAIDANDGGGAVGRGGSMLRCCGSVLRVFSQRSGIGWDSKYYVALGLEHGRAKRWVVRELDQLCPRRPVLSML